MTDIERRVIPSDQISAFSDNVYEALKGVCNEWDKGWDSCE